MKIAIFENIMTPGGHEVDFDRILVEELQALGHEIIFYVPANFKFQLDYHTSVVRLNGDSVSYKNSGGLRKILAAAKREINRQRWYSQLFDAQKKFDALIIPTATYRYLRALNHSALKKISVPLIFILHGVNPNEAPKLFNEAENLLPNRNIKPVVLTFTDNIFGRQLENISTIYPPTYTARDIHASTMGGEREKIPYAVQEKNFVAQSNSILRAELTRKWVGGGNRLLCATQKPNAVSNSILRADSTRRAGVLTIGFFGQYRREKKLRDLLKVYVAGKYRRAVRLLVQGSTMHAEDAADFEEIIQQYKNFDGLEFQHKGLIGVDWQRAIQNVDALLIPYSAPRFKYHWSGMLFTAIGYGKPVVTSDDMNPEVFAKYKIGEIFTSGNLDELASVLENFINGFDKNFPIYERNLSAAGAEFSPANFAKRLEKIICDG